MTREPCAATALVAVAVLAAGCRYVAERDPWEEARAAAREEAAAYWFDDARDPAEVFAPDREGRAIHVVRAGTGARIEPRSLVHFEVIGLDPADRSISSRHQFLVVVPVLGWLPGFSFPRPHGPELSTESRAVLERRGIGRDPTRPPALVTSWGEAPLPWDGVYRMRVGGIYELPHPTMATIRSLNQTADADLSLAEGVPGYPILQLAVLAACPADLRKVEHSFLEWNRDFIAYPRGVRTESWYELHGCPLSFRP